MVAPSGAGQRPHEPWRSTMHSGALAALVECQRRVAELSFFGGFSLEVRMFLGLSVETGPPKGVYFDRQNAFLP